MVNNVILDILDYLRYQVVTGKCTPEELRSINNVVIDNIDIDASVRDIAEFYRQSESNVRNFCSRNIVGAPKRRVYYNFQKIAKLIPKSWRK